MVTWVFLFKHLWYNIQHTIAIHLADSAIRGTQLKLAVNKQESWSIYIFCMENLLTILNHKMNIDSLLIAILMSPSLYGIYSKPSCLFTANLKCLYWWNLSFLCKWIQRKTLRVPSLPGSCCTVQRFDEVQIYSILLNDMIF